MRDEEPNADPPNANPPLDAPKERADELCGAPKPENEPDVLAGAPNSGELEGAAPKLNPDDAAAELAATPKAPADAAPKENPVNDCGADAAPKRLVFALLLGSDVEPKRGDWDIPNELPVPPPNAGVLPNAGVAAGIVRVRASRSLMH